MSDLLAVFGSAEGDEEVLDGIAACHPDRVTVLVTDGCVDIASEEGGATRDRLADLMAQIERRTGATVVGVAGDRSQLLGWRFDRELAPRLPLAA
jgi:hypothetical protein